MTTLAEELCKPDVVHLVDAFVRICPSLLINHSTLAQAFLKVTARDLRERAGLVVRPVAIWAWNVKLVLSRWRDIAAYPEKYVRAMRQADIKQRQTINRLRASIEPYLETPTLEELYTARGGTSLPSRSRPNAWIPASETSSSIYADHADFIYDLELELLDDKLPPQKRRIIEGQLSQTLALSLRSQNALGVDSPPKRRKPVDDAAVAASLEAIGADAPNFPSGDETPDMRGTRKGRPKGKPGEVKQDRRCTCARAYKAALSQALRDFCSSEEAYKRARVAGQKAGQAWDDVHLRGNAV